MISLFPNSGAAIVSFLARLNFGKEGQTACMTGFATAGKKLVRGDWSVSLPDLFKHELVNELIP
jgi:hypothetical protein